jgi:hypothetical protein
MKTKGRVEDVARLAVGLLLLLVASGCGGSGGASSAASPVTAGARRTTTSRPSSASTSRITGVTIAPGAAAGGPALLVVPRCEPADVEVSVDIQPRTSGPDAATWTRALIVVTADSAASCRLEGFAQVRRVQGLLVKPVIVQWVATGREDEAVTVRTGASGFAAVAWLSGPDCPQADGFEVVLPDDRYEVKVAVVGAVGSPHAVAVCGGSAELGPFVASAALANAEELTAPTR